MNTITWLKIGNGCQGDLGIDDKKLTLDENRHATPYHAPVYLTQKLGYFQDEGIKVSLLDEPFTGVVCLKDSGIMTDFRSLKGKKIGYVGEFGKVCHYYWYIE